MNAHEIRRRFLRFFEQRGHTIVPSSSLVPAHDPTLLFTNAGMVQFKDVFTGRDQRPYSRAVSVQRCLRAGGKHNDLDNVGFTPRHQTFFEMLGNFSFGDYFKEDAIRWAWEFLTEELKIPKERLVVSIYNGEGEAAPYDQEAFDLWLKYVPRERIYAFNAKENFWQMGDTGPCGPCSEIHIFHGDEAPPDAAREGDFGPAFEDDRYTELWNLVFMQYEKREDGSMVKLARPSIDTGAGLERLAAVMAGVDNNYETDLLEPLVELAKREAKVQELQNAPYRVIADHARATAFLIADGVFPDRTGREYVLRRIMRRAIRYGSEWLAIDEPFFDKICAAVVKEFGEVYPELRERAATIEQLVRMEEESFRRTLDRGVKLFQHYAGKLPEGKRAFPPEQAATLKDTYGIPPDLTGIMCREHGLTLDEEAVEAELLRRQAGRGGEKLGAGEAQADIYLELASELRGRTAFVGYTRTQLGSATVIKLLRDGAPVNQLAAGAEGELVLNDTPFYGESGGQIGDTGALAGGGARVQVLDTVKPTGDVHVHRVKVTEGQLRVGQSLHAYVDVGRRDAIRRNHSATHLLHHALREVLGPHVVQKGSLVAPDRLRFDFSHAKPLTLEERREIERRVNAAVLANVESETREMSLSDAKQAGAIGLFGEKYGDEVRVVKIGADSVELCGGTHVRRSGDIGLFTIISEGGIAQGVRRIEAVTGMGALEHIQHNAGVLGDLAAQLHEADADALVDRVEKLQAELKQKAREIGELQRKLATGGSAASDEPVEVEGVKLLAKIVSVANPKALREAADTLRDRLRSGVVILGAKSGGKAVLLVAATKDLKSKVHAGKLVKELVGHIDGRGGGRPDMAQAGGSNPGGLPAAIAAAEAALRQQLTK